MTLPDPSRIIERRFRNHMHFLQFWRIGNWAWRRRLPLIPGAIRIFARIIFSADIPVSVSIPRGVVFMHSALGTVVHTTVEFRGPALIFHHVTLGNARTLVPATPVIGRFVVLGTGCCILGQANIGDRVVVAANTVVTRDVPPDTLVFGNPPIMHPLPLGTLETFFPPEALG
jgi:serine O-acetyltransferase